MSRGPLPSQICLLSQLPDQKIADKVRFLGCVTSYSTLTACLELRHDYPKGNDIICMVDIGLLLESLGHEQTRIGEWLNVVGYVTEEPPILRDSSHGEKPRGSTVVVSVQAVIVWSTGPLDVEKYERTVVGVQAGGFNSLNE